MKMTEEQRQLAADNFRLVYSYMWSHKYAMDTVDDFEGILGEALCKAAMYYNPNMGYMFSTLCVVFMDNATKRAYKQQKCSEDKPLSLEYNYNESDNDLCTLKDTLIDYKTLNIEDSILLWMTVDKILHSFNENKQAIINDWLTTEDTYVNIGKRHNNISRERVRQIVQQFKDAMYKQIS